MMKYRKECILSKTIFFECYSYSQMINISHSSNIPSYNYKLILIWRYQVYDLRYLYDQDTFHLEFSTIWPIHLKHLQCKFYSFLLLWFHRIPSRIHPCSIYNVNLCRSYLFIFRYIQFLLWRLNNI